MEGLGNVLIGNSTPDALRPSHLVLQHALEDQQERFMEWSNGNRVWHHAVHDLVFAPGEYSGHPDHFKQDALEATVLFEHLIKKQLRTLYELNDKIEALSDENTARAMTKTEATERPKLSSRVKSFDETGEMIMRWGGRLIHFIPHLKQILDALK